MMSIPVDSVVVYESTRTATENPETATPRLEQNACFARPYRVVLRNEGYYGRKHKAMKYKRFVTEEKARKYLERLLFKESRRAAREKWKVIWP